MKCSTISTLLLLSPTVLSSVNAFVSPSFHGSSCVLNNPSLTQRGRSNDIKMEDFGLGIGEDPAENTPSQILGEARYKKFVGTYKENALLLGGQPNKDESNYDVIDRVSETRLLSLTAESGLLSALEAKGLTLSDLEKLLPLIDELNLLPLAKENKQFILNTLAPLVVEQSSTAIPLIVSLLKANPSLFFSVAIGAIGIEGALFLFSHNTLIDAIGSLVLLPLTVASFTAGNVLKKGLNVDFLASTAKGLVESSPPRTTPEPNKVKVTVAPPTTSFSSSVSTSMQKEAKSSTRPKVRLVIANTDSSQASQTDIDKSAPIKKPKKTFNFKASKPKQNGVSNWSTKNKY